MKYVLDTDHVSILQWPTSTEYAILVAHLNLHAAEGIGVSVVSFHEQMLGANNEISQAKTSDELVRGYERLADIIELYRSFPLVAFDSQSEVHAMA